MSSRLPLAINQPQFLLADGRPVPRNADGFPVETRDYVIDSRNWIGDLPQPNQRTVGGVLAYQNRNWNRNCFKCEQDWRNCPKGSCVRSFHSLRRGWDYRAQFEILPATNNMGLGVFAGTDLVEGEVLDEYFGELIPQRMAAARNDDDYVFTIANVASASARDYGNWTRFVNHSCVNFNVEPIDDVLGGRRTITFRAVKNIARGEQLFINYGPSYFGDKDNFILCRCPDLQGPHLPPSQHDETKANPPAFPRAQGQQSQPRSMPPDIPISQRNVWITQNKAWLDQQAPNGYPLWTKVHWRLLEQLIRRRRNYDNWRDKQEYKDLPSSRSDKLINKHVTTKVAQMTIKEWHLDVTKAFARDAVCGSKNGVPWGTDQLLKRVFSLVVAARRRRRRRGGRMSPSRTPPIVVTPVTPKPSGTSPGDLLTPPSTVGSQSIKPGDFSVRPAGSPFESAVNPFLARNITQAGDAQRRRK